MKTTTKLLIGLITFSATYGLGSICYALYTTVLPKLFTPVLIECEKLAYIM